ncbi:MAG: DNA-binding response regulator, partial [Bradyrhizobium sp.]|nr:DNA-binding response regulator [Bradyrhizobium sp.]
VSSKDHVQTSIEGGESTLGTAGAWALLANNGSGFHFGQTRTGLGTPSKFETSTDPSADATEESDGASAASAHGSSIELAHSATAPAVANVTSHSGPTDTGTGVSSIAPNEIGQPSVVTADNAGHGNSQHASEPGSAKDAATESTEAGSKPGKGDDNGAEHHASASEAPGGATQKAEPAGAEHGKSGHSTAASPPDAAEIDRGVATAAGAGHDNSQHASEPGSGKAAATESTEAGSKQGNDGGHSGDHHHASASDAAQPPATTAEPSGAEHGKSGHSAAASPPDGAEIDPAAATPASADHGNSQHASEPGSAKAASTGLTEDGGKPGNGAGDGAEHHASASDAAGTMKTAEPATVDHGNSQHAAQSAAIASDDAHPAKAAFEIGGADQGPVFRFDSGPTPSPLVAIVEVKEFNDPLDGHVPPSQEESLGFNAKLVPHALNGHADD